MQDNDENESSRERQGGTRRVQGPSPIDNIRMSDWIQKKPDTESFLEEMKNDDMTSEDFSDLEVENLRASKRKIPIKLTQ